MSDNDLIRRGDARRVLLAYASSYSAEEAETAIRALPAAPTFTAADLERAWQPIETAPKDGRLILAANIDPAAQNMVVVYWEPGSVAFNVIGHWMSSTHEIVTHSTITHWMPLPAPPADLAQRVKE